MRRWAALTALFTIPYGLAFLLHERPPTSGHALAGLAILGPGIILLGCIGGLSVQRSRSNAIALLVFQILTTACAMGALLMQRLPFTSATFLALLAFTIPVLGSFRKFGPDAWTPRPVTDRNLVVDVVVEVFLVAGALALMIGLRTISLGMVIFVLQSLVVIPFQVRLLRMDRSLQRRFPQFRGEASTEGPVSDDQRLAG